MLIIPCGARTKFPDPEIVGSGCIVYEHITSTMYSIYNILATSIYSVCVQCFSYTHYQNQENGRKRMK